MSTVYVTLVDDDKAEEASFSLSVLAAVEEPFFVRRQWSELKALAAEIGVSFTASSRKQAALPAFPQVREGADFPRVNEERLAEQALQRYFDATLQALPSEAERVVYCRALAMDLLDKRERAVPQTRTLRHGKTVALLARMGLNAARTRTANSFRSKDSQRASVMSPDNIALVVDHVCLLRGAAVKLAQKLNSMRNVMLVNEQLQLALDTSVLSNVYAMPRAQLVESLEQQLGRGWRGRFGAFNLTAFAAASLGEVHLATLPGDRAAGREAQVVVLKVQYPGVRESIDSDTEGLVTLLGATVSAESRYFELNQRMIETSRETWAQECDYTR